MTTTESFPAKPTPLPYVSESLGSMSARYAAAVAKTWNAAHIEAFMSSGVPCDRPTLHRTHVFDTHSGIRFIINREEGEEPGEYIHVAAATHGGKLMEAELIALKDHHERLALFGMTCEAIIARITGRTDFEPAGLSTHGIFHWTADAA